jgi:hypothetical protein
MQEVVLDKMPEIPAFGRNFEKFSNSGENLAKLP